MFAAGVGEWPYSFKRWRTGATAADLQPGAEKCSDGAFGMREVMEEKNAVGTVSNGIKGYDKVQ